MARQQTRAGGRDARRRVQCFTDRLLHARIGRETQIVVRTEIDSANCFEMAKLCPRFEIGKLGENALFHFHGGGFNEAAEVRAPAHGAWPRLLRGPDSLW